MSQQSTSYYTQLVAKCRRKDDKAWEEMIDLVSPVIFAITFRSKLTRDESFDIFGQVSRILYEHIEELQSPSKLMSYVATIARRQIYNTFRGSERVERIGRELLEGLPEHPNKAPDHDLEQEQERTQLLEAMAELPERDYKLLYALYFDPELPSYAEIGRKLRMPESSIGPTRARALQKMQIILTDKENSE